MHPSTLMEFKRVSFHNSRPSLLPFLLRQLLLEAVVLLLLSLLSGHPAAGKLLTSSPGSKNARRCSNFAGVKNVIIVGAGIAGASAAQELTQRALRPRLRFGRSLCYNVSKRSPSRLEGTLQAPQIPQGSCALVVV